MKNTKHTEPSAQGPATVASEKKEKKEISAKHPGEYEAATPDVYPEPAPEKSPEDPSPASTHIEDIERMMAEAERRGYLRCLNEMAQERMNRPELLENVSLSRTASSRSASPSPADSFLSVLPPRVWD